MIPLNDNRLVQIQQFLNGLKLERELVPELLDHLACEAEEKLWNGEDFDSVMHNLRVEASPYAVQYLNNQHFQLITNNTSLDEIVFEGRNREYGAYALRQEYSGHLQKAMLIGITVFLFLILLPKVLSASQNEPKTLEVIEVNLGNP